MFVIVYFLLFTSLLLKEVGSLSLYYLDIKRERRDEGGEGGMWHVYSVATIIARARGTSIYDVRAEGGVKKYPKFADKQNKFCGHRGGGGPKSVDVTYGSPQQQPRHSLHSTQSQTDGQTERARD